ncbi:MAG: hypothetical protein ACRC3Y_13860 [Romboutsia sp.]|uniref:hypothetical protein n=1 Tax=Romboutsia sp. TaxID=1965302 RepID=UPI003F323CEA
MQKIGIIKSSNKNLKYFEKLIESKCIELEDVYEINSLIIKPECIDISLKANLNKVKLCIKTDIKIVYLKKDDTSLYVYKDCYISYETIKTPNIIEGHYITQPSIINKLKKEIYTENINAKIINSNIVISYFLVLSLSANPTYYLSYVINNGFGDNVFLSHIDGQGFIQKTFYQNANINNLRWDISGSKTWFITNVKEDCNLCNIENESNKVNEFNVGSINNFILFKNNDCIVEDSVISKKLYRYNLKKNQRKPFLLNEGPYIFEKSCYDNLNKLTYFLMGDDCNKALYSLDSNNNVNTIFDYSNVLDYYVSYYLNNLVVKIFSQDKISLFEINLESKFSMQINLEKDYEDILDVKYLFDFETKKEVLILAKNKLTNNNTLFLYDFYSYSCTELMTKKILKIEIDYESLEIFIISKDKNLSCIEKLNIETFLKNKKTQTILKLPATIKDVAVKKVNYEK